MSDVHRQMVERVLQDVRPAQSPIETSTELSQAEVVSLVDSLTRFAVEQIVFFPHILDRLGFSREDALQGTKEAPNVSADVCEDTSRSSVLDWLLLNLPEQRLPKQFAASDNNVEVH
jgi:hypothetical protein